MTDFMTSLGFIGVGNMGLALMKGFADSTASDSVSIFGYDCFPDPDKRKSVENLGGTWLDSESEIAKRCKYILLGVKPQSVREVVTKIAADLTGESVIISICAGISSEFIRSCAGNAVKVVRVMPNTPVMLGLGASAVSADESVTAAELDFACSVFGSCGIYEVIPSDKMNEVICVNGSSPAFIYAFAKSFIDYAAEQGIDSESALSLFTQTLVGSAKMMSNTYESEKSRGGAEAVKTVQSVIDGLISQVCSPGGTTLAGMEQLRENGFSSVIKKACEACTARAAELAN